MTIELFFGQKQTNQQKTQKQFATTVNHLRIRPKQLSKRIEMIVFRGTALIYSKTISIDWIIIQNEKCTSVIMSHIESMFNMISVFDVLHLNQVSKNFGYSSHSYLLVLRAIWLQKL